MSDTLTLHNIYHTDSMAPKRKYSNNSYKGGKGGRYEEKPVEFRTVRSITFFTEEEKAYQAVLTFMDDEPLVGIQKMYFDDKTNMWKHTKKSVFMGRDAWTEFGKKFREIKDTFEPLFDNASTGPKVTRPLPPEVGTSSCTTSS